MTDPRGNFGDSAGEAVDIVIRVMSEDDLAPVSDAARAAGISINRELRRSKMIDGRGPRAAIGRLSGMRGVRSIGESTTFQLPPMDERVPQ